MSEHTAPPPLHAMPPADSPHDEATLIEYALQDFHDARALVSGPEVDDSGAYLLCPGCGSNRFCYDTGTGEAGARICTECGVVAPGTIIHGRRDPLPPRTSNYARIHHLHERTKQLCIEESQIPAEHMLQIGERLLDGTYTVINKDNIRAVLRSLGMQVYIEKWLQIVEKCTGVAPPYPGALVLQQLDQLFLQLQRAFDDQKDAGRKNFLNYNYVLCRLFQKMGCKPLCTFFPLIRAKPKLRALDEMYCRMAHSIGWKTPPLEMVPPFAVRLEGLDALRDHLRQRVALQIPAVPRREPWRMEFHKWGRQRSARAPPPQATRRSDRPEQEPQMFALRLKRRRSTPAESPQ